MGGGVLENVPVRLGGASSLRGGAGAGTRGNGTAEVFVEVGDHFFEGRDETVGFVVGGDDYADLDFGGLDGAKVRDGEAGGDGRVGGVRRRGRGLFLQTALGMPAVIPAGQRSGFADGAIGVGGDVGLFGWIR